MHGALPLLLPLPLPLLLLLHPPLVYETASHCIGTSSLGTRNSWSDATRVRGALELLRRAALTGTGRGGGPLTLAVASLCSVSLSTPSKRACLCSTRPQRTSCLLPLAFCPIKPHWAVPPSLLTHQDVLSVPLSAVRCPLPSIVVSPLTCKVATSLAAAPLARTLTK
jgi:hypothetical protein